MKIKLTCSVKFVICPSYTVRRWLISVWFCWSCLDMAWHFCRSSGTPRLPAATGKNVSMFRKIIQKHTWTVNTPVNTLHRMTMFWVQYVDTHILTDNSYIMFELSIHKRQENNITVHNMIIIIIFTQYRPRVVSQFTESNNPQPWHDCTTDALPVTHLRRVAFASALGSCARRGTCTSRTRPTQRSRTSGTSSGRCTRCRRRTSVFACVWSAAGVLWAWAAPETMNTSPSRTSTSSACGSGWRRPPCNRSARPVLSVSAFFCSHCRRRRRRRPTRIAGSRHCSSATGMTTTRLFWMG